MKRFCTLTYTLALLTLAPLTFLPNTFAQQVPFANVPFDTTHIPEPVPPPAAVRDFFELDPYYQQWINIRGFPVLASAEVSPYALKEAAWLIWKMVGHRPAILRTMAQNKARYVIIPHNKHTSDMPESNTGRLGFFWDVRHRAVHCRGCPISSDPEESLLSKSSSPIHHLGHLLQDWWLGWDGSSTVNNRVITLFNMAKAEGLYQNRYAGSTVAEYWAEGVGSWFNITSRGNVAPTRSALKKYDPRFANLLTEVFGDGDWRYTPPATRIHLPHLQGFNPEEAPIYQRPVGLLKLEAQLRDPNSDGDGKWVNLELHPPSQLRHLTASTTRGDRTDFIFGNLTRTDLTLYSFDTDGKKTLRYYSTTDDFTALDTHVGAIWLIEDHTGKDFVVFRAEEQVGRVLVGGPPSQDVLDVNSDGIVDLLDLTPIALRFGHRGANPADINKDRIVNIVDVLLVAGSVSALPQQAVETFKATEVQKWLTDAKQLSIEDEHQQKGIAVLEHLLAEIELPSKSTEVAKGPLQTVFEGHTKVVWSVAFSPDGQTLASASWDRTIRLWNLHTRQLETTLIGHTEDIMTVAFSPDNELLASAGWDQTILLWNVRTGELVGMIKAHTDGIESIVFSPDGEILASASADQTIRLWNVRTRQLEKTLTGMASIRSIAFSPNGEMLASGSRDNTIQLWNLKTGKHIRTLRGHTGWVNIVMFSPDGQTLGSSGSDRTIRLWNPDNGKHKQTLTNQTGWKNPVVFSSDSEKLLIGGRGISVWNTQTDRYEVPLAEDINDITSLVLSPDGQMVVSGSEDGTVQLWDVQRLSEPEVLIAESQRPPMYWIHTEAGTLHRLVRNKVENLAPNVKNATSLAVDVADGKLYWAEKTSKRTGRIRRANLDGTNVQLVKELTSVPYGIALDTANRKIYLTNSWGKVQRLNFDGSNFQPNLITGLADLNDIAVDVVNHKLYWTEKTSDRSSRIRRANLDGSNLQQVKILTNVPLDIAIDTSGGKIYLTDASGKIQRLNFDGSNFQPNLITGLKDPKGIAVDVIGGRVYWTEKGSIRRASFNGENIEEVATNLGNPVTLVLDMSLPSHVPSGTGSQETMTTPSADINEDGKVNKSDLLLVVTALGETSPTNPRVDVDRDGRVAIADLLLVIENLDDPVVGAAPTIITLPVSVDVKALEAHLNLLRVSSDGSRKYQYAIAMLEGLLASMRPTKTQLLANYPNPFNPETWIPYHLAEPADVTLTIYASDGTMVRTLRLGHQPVGIYQTRSRAAHWDGRNQLGESVASGVYFYTLSTESTRDSVTAGEFSATRKMLILK